MGRRLTSPSVSRSKLRRTATIRSSVLYHGWGGSKITPSSAAAQRWLAQGYAVFSMTDRGWGSSCGRSVKTGQYGQGGPCEHGYIHLMSRRYEVRDAQYLMGKLADEGVINPQEIGANGGSYGGGMSLELGSLKDRVELTNGELIPWTSPEGKPMKIAATAPEYPWSDLAQALQPNGSSLDYVANEPVQRDQPRIPLRNRKEQLERLAVRRRPSARLLPAAPKATPKRT